MVAKAEARRAIERCDFIISISELLGVVKINALAMLVGMLTSLHLDTTSSWSWSTRANHAVKKEKGKMNDESAAADVIIQCIKIGI